LRQAPQLSVALHSSPSYNDCSNHQLLAVSATAG
jgi:hypothetical protein